MADSRPFLVGTSTVYDRILWFAYQSKSYRFCTAGIVMPITPLCPALVHAFHWAFQSTRNSYASGTETSRILKTSSSRRSRSDQRAEACTGAACTPMS